MEKGQIWVETVIYTLIGLALLAVVLAIVTPRINEFRDKSILEQTISSMNALDSKLSETTSGGVGNARTVEFGMKRGQLRFDRANDKINFVLEDSDLLFSEPGVETEIGRVKVLTTEGAKKHKVELSLEYQFNLTFEGTDEILIFQSSSVPYKFRFQNDGFTDEGIQIVSFEQV